MLGMEVHDVPRSLSFEDLKKKLDKQKSILHFELG